MEDSSATEPLRPLLVGEDAAERLKWDSLELPSVTLTQRQLCDLELMLNGGFTPLDGFMDRESYEHVADTMRLPGGELWPVPVTLDVDRDFADRIDPGSRIALRDPEGLLLAVLDVSVTWEADKRGEAERVYGTTSPRHPGVQYLQQRIGEIYVGGRVTGIQPPTHYDYQELRHSPLELRGYFERLGWRRIIGFHTSRPIHKREREMTLCAAREARGHLLLHPVAGVTMHRDLNHFARIRCYQEIERHYPHRIAALSLLPLATRGAGPREALWHAIIRRNYGCTDFIVERDHASPVPAAPDDSDAFYPSGAAQELAQANERELGIAIVPAERFEYVPSAGRYVRVGDADATQAQAVTLGDADLARPDRAARRRCPAGSPIRRWSGCAAHGLPATPGAGPHAVLHRVCRARASRRWPRSCTAGSPRKAGARSRCWTATWCATTCRASSDSPRRHRDLNVRRIGFVASEITKNGGVAICAPIAPYAGDAPGRARDGGGPRRDGRDSHVCTPLEVCEARDRKGLYAQGPPGAHPGVHRYQRSVRGAGAARDHHRHLGPLAHTGSAGALPLSLCERISRSQGLIARPVVARDAPGGERAVATTRRKDISTRRRESRVRAAATREIEPRGMIERRCRGSSRDAQRRREAGTGSQPRKSLE